MELEARISAGGKVTTTGRGWLLSIPAGAARQYRLAQIDDHRNLPRSQYPCRAPLRLRLEARVSAGALPGTWGFGLWNDPYGFSFGPGPGFFRLPALPNAAWFFYSSPLSHLSFRDDLPGNGLLAQSFSSPRFDRGLLAAGLTFPFSRRAARRLLAGVIREDAAAIRRPGGPAFDPTAWHAYGLEWTAEGTRFAVDEALVLQSAVSPRSPLGLVLWIDNQHAGFDPRGRISFGLEPNTSPASLELRDLVVDAG